LIGRPVFADSITVSETYKDNVEADVYSSSTDTGTFNASLTIPGLSALSADDWTNLQVTIDSGGLNLAVDSFGGFLWEFSDVMSDAPNYGGTISGTNATFYFQLTDTNGNAVNTFKLAFSRAGNVLTIAGQTLNPAAVQPPWNIAAGNFFDESGVGATFAATNDVSCEIILQDTATTLAQYADVLRTVYLVGTNVISFDSDDNELYNIHLSGAADFTPPVLTAVSPAASGTVTNALLDMVVKATDNIGVSNVVQIGVGPYFSIGTNLWASLMLLSPGANVIQSVATDVDGNLSATNTLTLTFVNRQTNANLITFSEDSLMASQGDAENGVGVIDADAGVVNAALKISGLQAMSSDTWSNLTLSLAIGYIDFSGTLNAADSLTPSNATFYTDDGYELDVARMGDTLVLMIAGYGEPGLAQNYSGSDGPIYDTTTFAVSLANDTTTYLDTTNPIIITGTDVVSYDASGNELDQTRITGTADFIPPTLTAVSPAASGTVTNGLLAVKVKATDNVAVYSVEFFLDGEDYGAGVFDGTNQWTLSFALAPGANVIQTVATDWSGNVSPTNALTMTYVNKQTNANLITLSESWLDSAQTDNYGDAWTVNQDVGALNAALSVPGLQGMAASTWSNLVFTVAFGDVAYTNNLSYADVLTPTNAMFYVWPSGTPESDSQGPAELYLSRSGNTLVLAYETGNPSYYVGYPILADYYLGLGGAIQDEQPFTLALQDGASLDYYEQISRPVFIHGIDVVSYDSDSNELDHVQITGTADFVAPSNQITAPVAGQRWSNAVFTVTGNARDNLAVSNVYCSLDTVNWQAATSTNGYTNWSAQVNLSPGTNTIQAYAVDYSGNISATNSASVFEVVTGPLQVQITGLGRITPNDNNAQLTLYQTYNLSAIPASGFVFTNWVVSTNWVGGAVFTKTNLQFVMVSNLTVQANFIDVARPTNVITAPTANQQWSNSSFTITGLARDNWAVSNVFYSFDRAGWTNAVSGNNWTNWSAPVTLSPGTNTVRAFAMDTSGNYSATSGVSFFYVVSGQLQLSVAGRGTLSPNYSNAWLQIGKGYSITAAPAAGFVFTNWTVSTNGLGGVTTNTKTLPFIMASNLTLLATFVETSRPSLIVTAPTAGQRWSNALFTARGTAADNWQVAAVQYQLNNGGWNTAIGTNAWTASLNLAPGTNLFSVYAVSVSGLNSATNNLNIDCVVSNQLVIQAVGLGAISPNYSNAWLEIGRNYSITSTPASGFVFTNWTVSTNWAGGVTTNSKALQFNMASNLTLLATFVQTSRPSLTIATPTNGQRWSNAVFTATGTAADKWQVAAVQYQLNNGGWNAATGTNAWTAALNPMPGTNLLSAYAVNVSGLNSATNNVRFDFVVTNQLAIQTYGLGAIAPNYSNAWLEIGRNYSVTSTPASGFVFTNWTVSTNWLGGVTTNSKALQFNMASNLTLLATLVETSRPALTVTTPTNAQNFASVAASLAGKASDKWAVTNVAYSLNGVWASAANSNNWANWSATLTLAPGTNTISVYAQNQGGNCSATNNLYVVATFSPSVRMNLVAPPQGNDGFTFTLQLSGNGSGHLEYSPDLIHWTSWTNFEAANGAVTFHDPSATNAPMRFYRAVTP
jgi:hypothetical protein